MRSTLDKIAAAKLVGADLVSARIAAPTFGTGRHEVCPYGTRMNKCSAPSKRHRDARCSPYTYRHPMKDKVEM